MATGSYRREVEARIPALRQCARALAEGRDQADELVHDVLVDALRAERTWAGEDVSPRLFSKLVGANRARVRTEVVERRPASRVRSGTAPARSAAASGLAEPAFDDLLADLPLNEREALVLVVLGRLDYPAAAQALGVPAGVLVSRITQGRDKLGHGPWTARPAARKPGRAGPHLRLVKS